MAPRKVVSVSGVFGRNKTGYHAPRFSKGAVSERLPKIKSCVSGASRLRYKAGLNAQVAAAQAPQSRQPAAQELSLSLEAAQDEIVNDAFNSLFTAERQFNLQLEDSKSFLIRQATGLRSTHEDILTSFPNPTMGPRTNPCRRDSTRLDDSTRRICDLKRKITTVKATIEKSWLEWARIQQDIICLGAEVLGPQSLDTLGADVYGLQKKKFSQALVEHDKILAREQETREMFERQREAILLNTRDTLKELIAQERRRRDDTRLQNEEVCRLARKMAGGM